MKRILAVVEPVVESIQLLKLAREFSDEETRVTVLSVATEQQTAADRQDMTELTDGGPYRTGVEGVRSFADDLGKEVLGDVPYKSAGATGEKSSRILAAADEGDIDHLFMLGRKRSPTGKAMFGDATQAVLLNSEQPITLVMR